MSDYDDEGIAEDDDLDDMVEDDDLDDMVEDDDLDDELLEAAGLGERRRRRRRGGFRRRRYQRSQGRKVQTQVKGDRGAVIKTAKGEAAVQFDKAFMTRDEGQKLANKLTKELQTVDRNAKSRDASIEKRTSSAFKKHALALDKLEASVNKKLKDLQQQVMLSAFLTPEPEIKSITLGGVKHTVTAIETGEGGAKLSAEANLLPLLLFGGLGGDSGNMLSNPLAILALTGNLDL
ncbi:MAG: hypothetical protein KDK70_03455 [Myxococcales bacterium]|nr:hypothetical protein [Myxococcales bacterium]